MCDRKYHINCSGCKKSDKDTLIGKKDKCQWCDGTGSFHIDEDTGNFTTGEGGWCGDCQGSGEREYIPQTSQHHWARVDAYGIYTGIYCDKCYNDGTYPYQKDLYFDESYCGESLDYDY